MRARDIRDAKSHHAVEAAAAILDHGACDDIKGIPPPGVRYYGAGCDPNCDSLRLNIELVHAPADHAHAAGEAVDEEIAHRLPSVSEGVAAYRLLQKATCVAHGSLRQSSIQLLRQ